MRGRLLCAALLAACLCAPHAVALPRPVPPKDCGFLKAGGHRYNVKADQLRCDPARKYSKRYLAHKGKPKGYSCTRYSPSETAIAFRCTKGVRTFFAIRR